jgi:NADPH2:quinone reductase
MKAWRVHTVGEPADTFVLETVAEPTAAELRGLSMDLAGWVPCGPGAEPFDDWVLLEMHAAALGLPDVTTSRGTYPVPVMRPYIPGQEGVGTVIDAAPGRRELLGKRVAAVTMQPWGSLAPVAVGVSAIFEVPADVSDEEGAAFLIASHTGYHVAIRRGRVSAGETVVVLGAAGGLGSAILQLCIAQQARVIAVVGGPEKAEFCMRLGAEVVDHRAGDFVAAVRKLTDGRGVDVVLDPVQGQAGALARTLLVPEGRHVLCGHAGGLIAHDPDFYMFNYTLVGATLGSYPPARMSQIHAETQEALTALHAAGSYRAALHRSVTFDEVPEALADLAARRTIGRVVVKIGPSS